MRLRLTSGESRGLSQVVYDTNDCNRFRRSGQRPFRFASRASTVPRVGLIPRVGFCLIACRQVKYESNTVGEP